MEQTPRVSPDQPAGGYSQHHGKVCRSCEVIARLTEKHLLDMSESSSSGDEGKGSRGGDRPNNAGTSGESKGKGKDYGKGTKGKDQGKDIKGEVSKRLDLGNVD